MEIIEIELGKLVANRLNCNVMNRAFMDKLRGHIVEHGCYEPLVVRRDPERSGFYELINGHHRKIVLEELGYDLAKCVVWDLSDDQAMMVLATINRLCGYDDPMRRGELVEQLRDRFDEKELLAKLPETREQLSKLLSACEAPELVAPSAVDVPEAMMFFVTRDQKATIERALRSVGDTLTCDDSGGKPNRGDLFACMADVVLKGVKSVKSVLA